jgi:hypothetical protein
MACYSDSFFPFTVFIANTVSSKLVMAIIETDLYDWSLLKIASRNADYSGNILHLSRKQNSTSIQLKVNGIHFK